MMPQAEQRAASVAHVDKADLIHDSAGCEQSDIDRNNAENAAVNSVPGNGNAPQRARSNALLVPSEKSTGVSQPGPANVFTGLQRLKSLGTFKQALKLGSFLQGARRKIRDRDLESIHAAARLIVIASKFVNTIEKNERSSTETQEGLSKIPRVDMSLMTEIFTPGHLLGLLTKIAGLIEKKESIPANETHIARILFAFMNGLYSEIVYRANLNTFTQMALCQNRPSSYLTRQSKANGMRRGSVLFASEIELADAHKKEGLQIRATRSHSLSVEAQDGLAVPRTNERSADAGTKQMSKVVMPISDQTSLHANKSSNSSVVPSLSTTPDRNNLVRPGAAALSRAVRKVSVFALMQSSKNKNSTPAAGDPSESNLDSRHDESGDVKISNRTMLPVEQKADSDAESAKVLSPQGKQESLCRESNTSDARVDHSMSISGVGGFRLQSLSGVERCTKGGQQELPNSFHQAGRKKQNRGAKMATDQKGSISTFNPSAKAELRATDRRLRSYQRPHTACAKLPKSHSLGLGNEEKVQPLWKSQLKSSKPRKIQDGNSSTSISKFSSLDAFSAVSQSEFVTLQSGLDMDLAKHRSSIWQNSSHAHKSSTARHQVKDIEAVRHTLRNKGGLPTRQRRQVHVHNSGLASMSHSGSQFGNWHTAQALSDDLDRQVRKMKKRAINASNTPDGIVEAGSAVDIEILQKEIASQKEHSTSSSWTRQSPVSNNSIVKSEQLNTSNGTLSANQDSLFHSAAQQGHAVSTLEIDVSQNFKHVLSAKRNSLGRHERNTSPPKGAVKNKLKTVANIIALRRALQKDQESRTLETPPLPIINLHDVYWYIKVFGNSSVAKSRFTFQPIAMQGMSRFGHDMAQSIVTGGVALVNPGLLPNVSELRRLIKSGKEQLPSNSAESAGDSKYPIPTDAINFCIPFVPMLHQSSSLVVKSTNSHPTIKLKPLDVLIVKSRAVAPMTSSDEHLSSEDLVHKAVADRKSSNAADMNPGAFACLNPSSPFTFKSLPTTLASRAVGAQLLAKVVQIPCQTPISCKAALLCRHTPHRVIAGALELTKVSRAVLEAGSVLDARSTISDLSSKAMSIDTWDAVSELELRSTFMGMCDPRSVECQTIAASAIGRTEERSIWLLPFKDCAPKLRIIKFMELKGVTFDSLIETVVRQVWASRLKWTNDMIDGKLADAEASHDMEKLAEVRAVPEAHGGPNVLSDAVSEVSNADNSSEEGSDNDSQHLSARKDGVKELDVNDLERGSVGSQQSLNGRFSNEGSDSEGEEYSDDSKSDSTGTSESETGGAVISDDEGSFSEDSDDSSDKSDNIDSMSSTANNLRTMHSSSMIADQAASSAAKNLAKSSELAKALGLRSRESRSQSLKRMPTTAARKTSATPSKVVSDLERKISMKWDDDFSEPSTDDEYGLQETPKSQKILQPARVLTTARMQTAVKSLDISNPFSDDGRAKRNEIRGQFLVRSAMKQWWGFLVESDASLKAEADLCRTRPPSQMIKLMASDAALASAGIINPGQLIGNRHPPAAADPILFNALNQTPMKWIDLPSCEAQQQLHSETYEFSTYANMAKDHRSVFTGTPTDNDIEIWETSALKPGQSFHFASTRTAQLHSTFSTIESVGICSCVRTMACAFIVVMDSYCKGRNLHEKWPSGSWGKKTSDQVNMDFIEADLKTYQQHVNQPSGPDVDVKASSHKLCSKEALDDNLDGIPVLNCGAAKFSDKHRVLARQANVSSLSFDMVNFKFDGSVSLLEHNDAREALKRKAEAAQARAIRLQNVLGVDVLSGQNSAATMDHKLKKRGHSEDQDFDDSQSSDSDSDSSSCQSQSSESQSSLHSSSSSASAREQIQTILKSQLEEISMFATPQPVWIEKVACSPADWGVKCEQSESDVASWICERLSSIIVDSNEKREFQHTEGLDRLPEQIAKDHVNQTTNRRFEEFIFSLADAFVVSLDPNEYKMWILDLLSAVKDLSTDPLWAGTLRRIMWMVCLSRESQSPSFENEKPDEINLFSSFMSAAHGENPNQSIQSPKMSEIGIGSEIQKRPVQSSKFQLWFSRRYSMELKSVSENSVRCSFFRLTDGMTLPERNHEELYRESSSLEGWRHVVCDFFMSPVSWLSSSLASASMYASGVPTQDIVKTLVKGLMKSRDIVTSLSSSSEIDGSSLAKVLVVMFQGNQTLQKEEVTWLQALTTAGPQCLHTLEVPSDILWNSSILSKLMIKMFKSRIPSEIALGPSQAAVQSTSGGQQKPQSFTGCSWMQSLSTYLSTDFDNVNTCMKLYASSKHWLPKETPPSHHIKEKAEEIQGKLSNHVDMNSDGTDMQDSNATKLVISTMKHTKFSSIKQKVSEQSRRSSALKSAMAGMVKVKKGALAATVDALASKKSSSSANKAKAIMRSAAHISMHRQSVANSSQDGSNRKGISTVTDSRSAIQQEPQDSNPANESQHGHASVINSPVELNHESSVRTKSDQSLPTSGQASSLSSAEIVMVLTLLHPETMWQLGVSNTKSAALLRHRRRVKSATLRSSPAAGNIHTVDGWSDMDGAFSAELNFNAESAIDSYRVAHGHINFGDSLHRRSAGNRALSAPPRVHLSSSSSQRLSKGDKNSFTPSPLRGGYSGQEKDISYVTQQPRLNSPPRSSMRVSRMSGSPVGRPMSANAMSITIPGGNVSGQELLYTRTSRPRSSAGEYGEMQAGLGLSPIMKSSIAVVGSGANLPRRVYRPQYSISRNAD